MGRIGYALSFGTYAFMITSGFVVHCVFLDKCGAATADPKGALAWRDRGN